VTIIAHRGNAEGPSPRTENGLAAISAALRRGWGVEIDIRRADDGRFYISHDQRVSADDCEADDVCALLRRHPGATVALNVKELGYEDALIAYLERQRVLQRLFLFDMELVETTAGTTARTFKQLQRDVRVAARVSDRGESIERALSIEAASVVWLDEFDTLWCTEQDVRRLKKAGRQVYAVSPDLHHFSPSDTRRRWVQFSQWGVDGICTDYASALASVVEVVSLIGAAA
jgi:glycerophosphoryl diester phosphodiesterase